MCLLVYGATGPGIKKEKEKGKEASKKENNGKGKRKGRRHNGRLRDSAVALGIAVDPTQGTDCFIKRSSPSSHLLRHTNGAFTNYPSCPSLRDVD